MRANSLPVFLLAVGGLMSAPALSNAQCTPVPNGKFTTPSTGASQQVGEIVALDGTTALTGGSASPGSRTNIFVRSAGVWTFQSTLGNGALNTAAALSGDTALTGEPSDRTVTVWLRTGTTWASQATLLPMSGGTGDSWGSSVAVQGNTAAVGQANRNVSTGGPPFTAAGGATVFTRSGTSWSIQGTLLASDPGTNDHFGTTIALNGDTVVVGAPDKASGAGAAYVFTRAGTVWSLQQKLTAAGGAANDHFGASLALEGDRLLVGAPGRLSSAGAVYAFKRTSTLWTQSSLLIPVDGAPGDQFGFSVAMRGNAAVVGAPAHATIGAAYLLFATSSDSPFWNVLSSVAPTDTAPNIGSAVLFGQSVAVDGSTALVGAPGNDNPIADRGAAYEFTNVLSSPQIAQQPTSQTACLGGSASLTVSASSSSASPITYQWRRTGAPVVDGPTGFGSTLSGATTATLMISGATPQDQAAYDVIVSQCLSVTSIPVPLIVHSCCPADFNGIDGLSVADIFDFLAAWFAGCP